VLDYRRQTSLYQTITQELNNMPIRTRELTPHTGAEVLDYDLSRPVDPTTLTELESVFHDRGMLVFKNQSITEDQHIQFSQHFGELEIHVLAQYLLKGHPEILIVSNIESDGKSLGIKDAGQYWHTDLSYKSRPSRCSILHAREIPAAVGDRTLGDTCFVNTAAAFEALDPDMKAKLMKLRAVHHYEARYKKQQGGNSHRTHLTEEQKQSVPPVVHPVVRTHSATGRKCIYVNEGFTVEIVGMPKDESDALLRYLFNHCTNERFMYRHKWTVGDVLMWDNCLTQHLAIADYALPQRRLMYRTTVSGSEVV
jgi:taurine dioxygenase